MEKEVINLKEEIENYQNDKEFSARERDYFYVSEIGRSEKEVYDAIVNKKPFEPDARVQRILENGDKMHERYTKLFAEMGILVAAEIDAVNNELVHGRLDCLITDRKQNYVVELKSCSQWVFNKLNEPKSDHNLQIQFYMYYTNVPRGFVLYENKDNQSIKCFYVELDKELVEKHIKRLEKLKENINKKVEPEVPITKMEDLKYGI